MDIEKEIDKLEKARDKKEEELEEINKKIHTYYKKLNEQEKEEVKNILSKTNIGDCFLVIDKEESYHYNPITLYEVLDITEKKVKFRIYTSHVYDGEINSIINIEDKLIDGDLLNILNRKCTNIEKELVNNLILNPYTNNVKETLKLL